MEVTFTLPFIPKSKKNCYGARGSILFLRAEAKREIQAIRDCARAYLLHDRGGINGAELERFVEDAMRFRAGLITPKKWDLRCEFLENTAAPAPPEAVEIKIEFFRERGPATEGSTRVTVRTLWPLEGDVRRMTDVDGAATTLLDALEGVLYRNDRQVDALHVQRFRLDEVTQQSPVEAVVPQP